MVIVLISTILYMLNEVTYRYTIPSFKYKSSLLMSGILYLLQLFHEIEFQKSLLVKNFKALKFKKNFKNQ